MSKLTTDDLHDLLQYREDGLKMKEIARKLGVTRGALYHHIHRMKKKNIEVPTIKRGAPTIELDNPTFVLGS